MSQTLNLLAKVSCNSEEFDQHMADDIIVNLRDLDRPQSRNEDKGEVDERGADVMFEQRELSVILSVYGRMVAQGEWRDYAIGMGRETAVFAVFRHASELPLYRIEKHPKLRNKQGMYCVVASGGLIMKRGHDLAQVLRALEPKRPQLVE